ncbi:MAG: PfkB family carbohydrate kinase, partial [Rhodospirillaceae bacterium]
DAAFREADWFHISGITPALSEASRQLATISMQEARRRNIHVSLDLNYRERLWQYGARASDVMPNLAALADTLIAGRGDCAHCLGVDGTGENGIRDWAESLTEKLFAHFPGLSNAAITLRDSQSAERHSWSAHLRTGDGCYVSRNYEMTSIVDRVGTGDAFCAGLIFGLAQGRGPAAALEFGAAANCLKHSIQGDSNAVTVEEVNAIADTDRFGQLRR